MGEQDVQLYNSHVPHPYAPKNDAWFLILTENDHILLVFKNFELCYY